MHTQQRKYWGTEEKYYMFQLQARGAEKREGQEEKQIHKQITKASQ